VQVRVKVLNPDGLLKPDMNATVSFLSPRKLAATREAATSAPAAAGKPVIRVPASAVRDGAVFVVEDGRAVKRSVDVAKLAGRTDVEVRNGLIGGEDLIVSPPESLEDGTRVRQQVAKS
jgi:hypothetical protein